MILITNVKSHSTCLKHTACHNKMYNISQFLLTLSLKTKPNAANYDRTFIEKFQFLSIASIISKINVRKQNEMRHTKK